MTMKQLHPGVKWSMRIGGFFGSIIWLIFIGVFLGPYYIFSTGSFGLRTSGLSSLFGVIFILLLVWVEVHMRLFYKFFKYEFADDQLVIEKGIIWKKYSHIPYQKIQNIDVTRGIFARAFGFSSLNVQTAGYSASAGNRSGYHSEGYIPAVSVEDAEKIRTFVLKKISKRKGNDF